MTHRRVIAPSCVLGIFLLIFRHGIDQCATSHYATPHYLKRPGGMATATSLPPPNPSPALPGNRLMTLFDTDRLSCAGFIAALTQSAFLRELILPLRSRPP